MRVRVASLSLSAIQDAVNKICDAITWLTMSRSAGIVPEDTEDISKPAAGRLGYNRSTSNLSRFDGETWVDQAGSGGASAADDVTVSTSAFDNNLSAADDTVQKALDTLDDMVASSGGAALDDIIAVGVLL